MDALEIDRAHIVGNSMGGRVALEVGMRAPDRVRALGLLCPAVAFVKRDFHPLVRLARPEFGLLPHRFTRGMVARQFWSMFRDPDAVDPAVADVAVDEFQRIYASAGARMAFLCSARNIYLDKPFGKGGFYPRLSDLEAPSLFIWGSHDPLIPAAFKRHVGEWLPRAEQIVLDECGHVPQVERPEQTNGLLRRFFARHDALLDAAARARREREAACAAGRPLRRTLPPHGRGTNRGRAVLHQRAPSGRPQRPGPGRLRRRSGALLAPDVGDHRGGVQPDPAGRPRRARPRLHPRAAPGPLAAVEHLLPRRGPRPRQHPRARAGADGRQPLGRQPHARHARLHARLLRVLRRGARLLPARPQPRALDARTGILRKFGTVAASRENARKALESGAALLVYPGGDYEVHRPSWEGNKVDFDGRKGFIRTALEHDVPIVPVVSIGGQETALFLSRGEWLAKALMLDKMFRLKVLPISLALPWGLNVGDMMGHVPLPAKITVEALPPIHLRKEFGDDPDVDEIYEHIIRLMQDTLDALAAERRLPVIG